jgi:hypothetical protein
MESGNAERVFNYLAHHIAQNTWRGYHSILPDKLILLLTNEPSLANLDLFKTDYYCLCSQTGEDIVGDIHRHTHFVWLGNIKPPALQKRVLRAKAKVAQGVDFATETRNLKLVSENHFVNAVLYVCGEEASGEDHSHISRNVPLTVMEKDSIRRRIRLMFPKVKQQHESYISKRGAVFEKARFFAAGSLLGLSRDEVKRRWTMRIAAKMGLDEEEFAEFVASEMLPPEIEYDAVPSLQFNKSVVKIEPPSSPPHIIEIMPRPVFDVENDNDEVE